MKTDRCQSKKLTRSVAAVLAAASITAGSIQPAQAQVAGSSVPPQVEQFFGDVGSSFGEGADALNKDLRDRAWNLRNLLNSQISLVLNEAQARQVTGFIDGAVNAAFPGLIAERTAPRPAARPAPAPAQAPQFVNGCSAEATACYDKARDLAWLQRDGKIYYGPVKASSGVRGNDLETPNGIHAVNRKVKDEISHEFNNAPMPYAVYFTYNGHAFHQGGTDVLSHGCIHLNHNDAVTFFNELQIGEKVHIF